MTICGRLAGGIVEVACRGENFILSAEEALFYAERGALAIADATRARMELDTCWGCFCR
jgi:hypothetical protein